MNHPNPKRQKEIGLFMTAHNWLVDYKPNTDQWIMMREPYAYSPGPYEVLAIGFTLEEAFDKAKQQLEKRHANPVR